MFKGCWSIGTDSLGVWVRVYAVPYMVVEMPPAELTCLLAGLNFLLHTVPDECFYLSDPVAPETATSVPFELEKPIYPYLLVNIGSGVSILRVDSPDRYVTEHAHMFDGGKRMALTLMFSRCVVLHFSFERVSGTCIGGGTYLGLCRLLTKYKDFDAVMELCQKGDPTKCDMLVGYV